MSLAAGTRVGVYEVVSLLGAGGMGEVYRARDPRLQRDVALKIFSSNRAGGFLNLFSQAADGTGTAERLFESQSGVFPLTVSPDGMRLVFRAGDVRSGDLMIGLVKGEAPPQPLLQTPFNELNGEISPDGHWLAYDSNESGQYEIYVRPYPNVTDDRWQVSTGGGTRPLWTRNGQELFYLTPAGDALMSANVSGGPGFKTSIPTKLFDARAYLSGGATAGRTYDVSPDGQRLLLIKTASSAEPSAARQSIVVAQNWLEELKRRVPAP